MAFQLTRMEELGSEIRRWREAADLSQADLAKRLGTSQSAVSRWESGRDEPRLSTIASILRACELEGELQVGPGVDRAQIRQQLAMTPRQRLESVANVARLRSMSRRRG